MGRIWVLLWWVGPCSVNLNPIFCWWVGLCSLPVVWHTYSKGNGNNGELLQRGLCQDGCIQCPWGLVSPWRTLEWSKKEAAWPYRIDLVNKIHLMGAKFKQLVAQNRKVVSLIKDPIQLVWKVGLTNRESFGLRSTYSFWCEFLWLIGLTILY